MSGGIAEEISKALADRLYVTSYKRLIDTNTAEAPAARRYVSVYK